MNIPQWAIYSKHDGKCVCTISATSQDSAWRKFCTQRFGPLKPCRDDYGLRVAPPEKWKGVPADKCHQTVLLSGLSLLPNQQDLFQVDGS